MSMLYLVILLFACPPWIIYARSLEDTAYDSAPPLVAEGHGEFSAHGGNRSANISTREHHDVHVASWQYSYVRGPLLISSFIVAVCIIKIVLHHAQRLEKLIPESCLLILLGIVIGFLFLVERAQTELNFLHFSPRSFFLFLLPPIILEAAYSLKDRAFVENLGTIVLYAVVGTILNVFLVGPALFGFYMTGMMGSLSLTFLECLIFSVVIAAVDPVAVLAIFEEIGVNKMLYFMVFGESLFNDAVTVVIYNMVLSFMQIEHVGARELGLGLAAFLSVSLGGMVIGAIYGFLTALATKYSTKMRVLEPAIIYSVAYLSYLSAELFHFSGIISIICCGLIQSYYASENISSKSYITVYHFSKVMSSIAESLIFIILGVMLVNEYKSWVNFNPGFAIIAVVLCIVARFAVTFFLAYIVNSLVVSVRKIRKQEQFIMAYGGLRGAVTFSLVFMLEPKVLERGESTKDVLLTSAYLIIFITTFLQGISIKPLVKLMRIRLEAKETTCLREINTAIMDNGMAGMEEIIGHHGSYYWGAVLQYLSDRFVRPAVQKFPNRNRSYSSFLAAYQEAHMKERYTGPPPHALSHADGIAPPPHDHLAIPITHSALWTELDMNDRGHIPHNVTDLELERQDEYGYELKKEHEQVCKQKKKQRPYVPPLKLDSPEDLMTLRDILQTPPHKKVHYVFDKGFSDDEDRHESILKQVRHATHIRKRHHNNHRRHHIGARKDLHQRVNNAVLESALIPLGIAAVKKRGSSTSLRHLAMAGTSHGKREHGNMRRITTAEGRIPEIKVDEATGPSAKIEEEVDGERKVTFSLGDSKEQEKTPSATETDNLL